MPALSFANAVVHLKAAVDLLDETEKYGQSLAAANFDALHDTYIAANVGDFSEFGAAAVARLRARIASALTVASVRDVLTPSLLELGAAINSPSRDPIRILDDQGDREVQVTPAARVRARTGAVDQVAPLLRVGREGGRRTRFGDAVRRRG